MCGLSCFRFVRDNSVTANATVSRFGGGSAVQPHTVFQDTGAVFSGNRYFREQHQHAPPPSVTRLAALHGALPHTPQLRHPQRFR